MSRGRGKSGAAEAANEPEAPPVIEYSPARPSLHGWLIAAGFAVTWLMLAGGAFYLREATGAQDRTAPEALAQLQAELAALRRQSETQLETLATLRGEIGLLEMSMEAALEQEPPPSSSANHTGASGGDGEKATDSSPLPEPVKWLSPFITVRKKAAEDNSGENR